MDEQRLIGILIIFTIVGLAILGSAWVLKRQERARSRHNQHGRRRQELHVQREPEPGSFAAAVLSAERAGSRYQEAALTGNLDSVIQARQAITKAHIRLVVALAHREVERRRREQGDPYASGPEDVSVSESHRLAGEPNTNPGRRE